MDPKSNKDGTFKPRNSMVMDGHCETALFKIRCLVSLDTVQLFRVSHYLFETCPQIWLRKVGPTEPLPCVLNPGEQELLV